ncbi:MAG TPA: hypothetical protein PKD55_03480, partial [Bellilinea sp.]|nr:hypothetical protein [Bellilinea sp.]
ATDLAGRAWMIHPLGFTISNWDGQTLNQQELNDGWDVAFLREQIEFPTRTFNSDTAGNVWLVTRNDMRFYNGRKWTLHSLYKAGLPHTEGTGEPTALSAIGIPGTTDILVAGCRFVADAPTQGITPRLLYHGVWEDFREFGQYPCITQLGSGQDGSIYAVQTSTLWHYDPEHKWQKYPLPAEHEGQHLVGILEVDITKDHAVWVIVGYGDEKNLIRSKVIYQLVGETWQSTRASNQFAVQKLLFKADGRPILWENQQLFSYDATILQWTQLTNADIKAATADSNGGIWAVTEDLRQLSVWYQP